MKEKSTAYLNQLFSTSPAIEMQYVKSEFEGDPNASLLIDPLREEEHEAVKGLVHKYSNRALIKTSYRCAAHCRFCTRYRQIGTPEGDLDSQDIANIGNYLRTHQEIDDVILSGGDPLYTPKTTSALLEELRGIDSIKVFRIGTRLPVHNPQSFRAPLLQKTLDLAQETGESRPFFVLINFQHPDELTSETLQVTRDLRRRNLNLLSQTVFLKGVNNSAEVLKMLFEGLYHSGIVPYYIFRCDYARGVERFICDIEEEQQIMTQLRSTLSGIACPTYVVDVPGKGKIPVPLGFWNADLSKCQDFEGQNIDLDVMQS